MCLALGNSCIIIILSLYFKLHNLDNVWLIQLCRGNGNVMLWYRNLQVYNSINKVFFFFFFFLLIKLFDTVIITKHVT